jgi:hypothetical protein
MRNSINALKCLVFVTLLGCSLGACSGTEIGVIGKVQRLQQVAWLDGEQPGRG